MRATQRERKMEEKKRGKEFRDVIWWKREDKERV